MAVRSDRRCTPASFSCSPPKTLAWIGVFASGVSPQPPMVAGGAVRPVTVIGCSCAGVVAVCATACVATSQAAAVTADSVQETRVVREMKLAIVGPLSMAGRRARSHHRT